MPPSKPKPKTCAHTHLQLEPSAYAVEAGFEWPPLAKRIAATTKAGRGPSKKSGATKDAHTVRRDDEQLSRFPGPLVLPWDDLGWDPDAGSQSFKSWHQEPERNKPTTARRSLYVFEVPDITGNVKFMEEWLRPQVSVKDSKASDKSTKLTPVTEMTPSPKARDVVEYLAAFYHGMPTKLFPQRLRFVPWEEKSKSSKKQAQQQYVGLATAQGNTTRIRARPSPDGVFAGQLNLEDILDAAIDMLPGDAYAIVLLMDHDLYEDEEDDFCCGRAYGGSRVSVVSTARYRPELDEMVGLDLTHMWPASHCKDYAATLCAEQDIHNDTRNITAPASSPIRAAVDTAASITHSEAPGLWFSRIVRTASHELGHCLALDHCIYYACLMQSTSGIAEDVRQPPYLCPVCISKVSHMVAIELQKSSEEGKAMYVKERYEALANFCDRWKHVGLFAGYQAWLEARLRDLASE
ncbi:hypothetical protein Q7P37_009581 [Cladosporium fusiforme]